MSAWWADSLDRLFPDAAPTEAAEWMAQAARSEVVSLQFVMRADRGLRGDFSPPQWRAVGCMPVKKNTQHTPPEELIRPAPDWRRLFEPDRVKSVIHEMLHPEERR